MFENQQKNTWPTYQQLKKVVQYKVGQNHCEAWATEMAVDLRNAMATNPPSIEWHLAMYVVLKYTSTIFELSSFSPCMCFFSTND